MSCCGLALEIFYYPLFFQPTLFLQSVYIQYKVMTNFLDSFITSFLHSFGFVWCLFGSSFTRTLTSVHSLTFFWPNPLIFLLSGSLVSASIFLSLRCCPLHPCVHSYLWSLWIYYCWDQPVRITETSSQPHGNIFHPCALGKALKRPLSSCLLFTWMVGAVCVCVHSFCLCESWPKLLKDATKCETNEQLGNWMTGQRSESSDVSKVINDVQEMNSWEMDCEDGDIWGVQMIKTSS